MMGGRPGAAKSIVSELRFVAMAALPMPARGQVIPARWRLIRMPSLDASQGALLRRLTPASTVTGC